MLIVAIFVGILVWFLKNYLFKTNTHESPPPIYFNVNIGDICKGVSENVCADGESTNKAILGDMGKHIEVGSNIINGETGKAPPNEDYKKKYQELLLKNMDQPDNVDLLYYGGDEYILQGDDKLTYKMIDMSMRNKHAINNRALWNKNSLLPYFEEELRSHENSIWWDDDTLDNQFKRNLN